MTGIKTRLRQLKTLRSKILSLMAATLLLLGSSLPVYASSTSELIDANLSPVPMTAGTTQVTGHLTPYQIVDNYGLTYDLTNTNGTYDLEILPNSGYITVIFKGLCTISNSWTGLSGAQLQSAIFGVTDIRTKLTVSNLGITSTIERVSAEELTIEGNYSYSSSGRLYNYTSNSFEILDNGHFIGQYVSDAPRVAYNVTVFASYRVPCTDTNLQSVLANLATQTVSVSGSDTRWNLSLFYGEYNILEMLNAIHTMLFDIKRYDQSTYGAVVQAVNALVAANSNLSTIISYLSTVNSYLADILADTGSIYGEVSAIYNMLDEYLNPSAAEEASSNLESIQESLESQAAVADEAVESAIPSAESELAVLESYSGVVDLQSTHATAINFWKQVGEYILDPINLGAAASVLIAASVLAFIVFLLRL